MMAHDWANSKCGKAALTKNHILLCIHHLVGPGEGLTQTSHVLWREQTVLSPVVRSEEKRQVTGQHGGRNYY